MPRAKKTKKMFTVEIEASVIITACYEIESYSLEEATGDAEDKFEGEFDIYLKEPSDCGFDIQDIESQATEEES